MEQTIKQNKMGYMPEGKLLLSMSLPIVLSMLIMALYNIVDSYFVAKLSEDALTAVSLAFPIQMLMVAVTGGTGTGLNALLSRRLGERRFEEANATAMNGLFLALVSYLAFLLVGQTLVKPYFQAFTNESAAITEQGIDYLSIVCTLSFGMFFQICVERIMQAQGKTVAVMLIQISGAVINIILDPIMIFGLFGCPALGVAGAAYATVIGQWGAMILSFVLLFFTKHEVHLNLRKFRPSLTIIKDIYSVGFPAIIMQAIGTVMNFAMNAIFITYSTTAVAVFGVYFKIQSVIFMPIIGMMSAGMSIIAYNYGARNKKRMLRTLRISMIFAVTMMAVGTILFQLFPDKIYSVFATSDEAMSIAVVALKTVSLHFVTAGISIPLSYMFQAVNRGYYSLTLSLCRQLFALVPAALIISVLTHDLDMIWYAWLISEGMALFISLFFFARVNKTILKPMDEAQLAA